MHSSNKKLNSHFDLLKFNFSSIRLFVLSLAKLTTNTPRLNYCLMTINHLSILHRGVRCLHLAVEFSAQWGAALQSRHSAAQTGLGLGTQVIGSDGYQVWKTADVNSTVGFAAGLTVLG